MKFVCDRCQTRYSIADEKVRQKILRIRCKTCGNVLVVQEEHPRGSSTTDGRPAEPRPSSSGNLKAAPSSGPKPPPPPPPRPGKGPDQLGGRVEWYVAIDGEQSGPFSRAEVAKRIHAAGTDKSVHVWKEGMSGWKTPREVSVVAHELALLRPAPPPPRPAAPGAPVGKVADSDAPTTPLPLAGGRPPVIAAAAPTEITVPEVSGFSDVTTKKGKELRAMAAEPPHDDFAEITTKKTKELRDMAAGASPASYTEATTKKSKNLRELEADAPTAPGVDVGEPDRTPPPMKPLPPVGSKVASPVPPAVRVPPPPLPDPVVAFETPPPVVPRPSASFAIPGTSLPAPAPAFKLPSRSSATVGMAAPGAQPATVPGRPPAPFAVPPAPMTAPPSTPFVVSGAPRGPLLSPGDLPTPRPVNLVPFAGVSTPPVTSEPEPGKRGIAALFQRQPGLKYVVAVLAIVGLIILLGLVILRGGDRTTSSEAVPAAQPEPEPEPAKTEEPKLAIAETVPPARAPREKPSPAGPSSPKAPSGSSGRSARHVAAAPERPAPERPAPERPAPERAQKENPPASPPRLAARPNPFDDSRNVSQAQITAVVRNPANQAALKSCYERALKMDNHLTSGRIDVTVSIGTSGAVQRVVINAPSSFILVEPCIKSAVKRWAFPPNVEDYATNFPLIMQGGM